MIFLGDTFFGADRMCIPLSPTLPRADTYVTATDIKLDTLYVTKETDSELTVDIPDDWDFDTIMLAKFNGNPLAGNLNYKIDDISHILIKRRIVGDYDWITLKVQEIHSEEDLHFSDVDYTTENLLYEYALVPILSGIEGAYSSINVDAINMNLVILDKTGVWWTPLTNGFCNTTDVAPNAPVETIYGTYPIITRNTNANYETIDVEASFYPHDDCLFDFGDDEEMGKRDRKRILYQRALKRFLANGKTKILKNVDGQAWLVYVTTPPSDTADTVYNDRNLTFTCTEVGDLRNERDLYEGGLSDVEEEWWSNNT